MKDDLPVASVGGRECRFSGRAAAVTNKRASIDVGNADLVVCPASIDVV